MERAFYIPAELTEREAVRILDATRDRPIAIRGRTWLITSIGWSMRRPGQTTLRIQEVFPI